MKTLFGILLCVVSSLVSSFAATFAWDQNTEPDILEYRGWLSANGGGFLPTIVPFPTHQITYTNLAAGNNYQFYVTAINTNQLESVPSTILLFTPPPTPPPLNVQKVIVMSYNGAVNSWNGVQVYFDTVNLATYQATNYVITATSPGGATLTMTAPSSPAIFPSLAVQNYNFGVSLQNASGTSPTGTAVFLSGSKPVSPANVRTQTGP